MRTQPREKSKQNLFKCGTRTTTVVSSSGGIAFNFFCERWDCEKCRKWKIRYIQNRINRFKGIFVYTGNRPDGQSHFIERFIRGDYVSIRFDHGKFIICERSFKSCTRRDKRTFIKELPTLMAPIMEGRRISYKRIPPPPPLKDEDGNDIVEITTEDFFLGRVAGDHRRTLKWMTPIEKVRWMLQQPDRIIFPGGRRLLEDEPLQRGLRPP